MTRKEAEKELIAMLKEAEDGPTYSMEEVDAYMRELLHPKNQIYLTGDTHGQFERIISLCERQQVQPESTFIILGDAGLNYYGDRRDNRGKDKLAKIPITFFCIHGNHEMRPSEELGYQVKEYHGGKVWIQPEYCIIHSCSYFNKNTRIRRENTMNKTELIAVMAETSGLSKKDCDAALAAFITTVETALKSGEKVQLIGFGSFEVKERAARTGRNPRTKETVEIPASKAPVFKAGQAFKDAIR